MVLVLEFYSFLFWGGLFLELYSFPLFVFFWGDFFWNFAIFSPICHRSPVSGSLWFIALLFAVIDHNL